MPERVPYNPDIPKTPKHKSPLRKLAKVGLAFGSLLAVETGLAVASVNVGENLRAPVIEKQQKYTTLLTIYEKDLSEIIHDHSLKRAGRQAKLHQFRDSLSDLVYGLSSELTSPHIDEIYNGPKNKVIFESLHNMFDVLEKEMGEAAKLGDLKLMLSEWEEQIARRERNAGIK